MTKRPIAVTIIGWIFIAAGIAGIVYHANELTSDFAADVTVVLALLIRVLAIVGGIFLLRRAGWARWLLVTWIAYHAVLSAFHSWQEFALHAAILGLLCVLLYIRQSNEYFSTKD